MHSLRVKLLAPFILGTLALTMLLSWYTYNSAREAVRNAMLIVSEAKTSHAVSSMTLLFRSASTSLQNMVADTHVTDLFSPYGNEQYVQEKTASWLSIITQGNEFYRDVLIVDTDGVCISSSNPGHVGVSFAQKPYVAQALGGMFTLGESSVGKVTKRLSAVAAGPVDVAGKIAGALVMYNDFPQIVDYSDKNTYDSKTIFTAMLSPEGLFEAHKDRALMGSERQVFPQLYRELTRVGEQGGEVEYTLIGESYVGYAKIEPYTQWVVITSGIKGQVYASAYEVGLTVLGISGAFLCLITFVVVRFANGILSLLLSLISYAKTVSEGNFSLSLPPSRRRDELGVLNTALQRLVEALRRMLEETREASKMKGQFLANMSHEIRTPLNAIIGMVHLSLRDGGLPEKQRGYLDKIQIAAKSLLGVINDVLDLSKVEAGMLSLEYMPFSLRDTVNNALAIYQQSADAKGLRFQVEFQENMPEWFLGDPLRVGQVLNNLLSNAIKFTAEGTITVTCAFAPAPPVPPDANSPGMVSVSVTDTGIGMNDEAIANLFQPFTQADASITRKFGGTGLGLAISNRLVQLLGGEFSVVSAVGQGTIFTFTMRLETTAAPESGALDVPVDAAFEKLNLEGRHILVAEDNAINQLIMQELIAPSGATVIMANDGLEAVDAVKRQHFDLVFMDMQMPTMDGLEATRTIRQFMDANTLPIIAVTANAMQEDRDRSFASGMNDYITKPIEPMELLEKLTLWLCPQKPDCG